MRIVLGTETSKYFNGSHKCGSSSVVECYLAKVNAVGSNPIFRSIFRTTTYLCGKGRPMRKREKKEKRCLNCGGLIPNRNVYCNNKCQGEYSTKITFAKIESGDTSFYPDTYKKYLIHKFGNKCMKCGWGEINLTTGLVPIQLEHKDGNSENNS